MASSKPMNRPVPRADALGLSRKKKMEYFKQIQVMHWMLENAADDLTALLDPDNEECIFAVIGAPGVGKTTLARLLLPSVLNNVYAESSLSQSSTPLLYVEPPANGDKSLSWTAIYQDILKTGREIAIDKKLAIVKEKGTMRVASRGGRTPLYALRQSLESMLQNRGVRVLAMDEAFHLLRFGGHTGVMDTLKSLVNRTGVKIVLMGSYDLLALVGDHGQVIRRSEVIHFHRYHLDKPDDRGQFKVIVRKLQEHWPCEDVPNFIAISKHLQEASLGCTGLLKALLLRALSAQLRAGGKWDPRFLVKAAKSIDSLSKLRIEIERGEESIEGAEYGSSIFNGDFLKDAIAKMAT